MHNNCLSLVFKSCLELFQTMITITFFSSSDSVVLYACLLYLKIEHDYHNGLEPMSQIGSLNLMQIISQK